jgi:hypothetical protein
MTGYTDQLSSGTFETNWYINLYNIFTYPLQVDSENYFSSVLTDPSQRSPLGLQQDPSPAPLGYNSGREKETCHTNNYVKKTGRNTHKEPI